MEVSDFVTKQAIVICTELMLEGLSPSVPLWWFFCSNRLQRERDAQREQKVLEPEVSSATQSNTVASVYFLVEKITV
jgi:hypothetical protein